jgi:hypothetical protein
MGVVGALVQTTSLTSVGDAGKQLKVTITSPSQPSGTDYLGIYRTGDGNAHVSSGETFPSGVTQRSSLFWGIHEYGSVTTDLVIDYSAVPGITAPAAIQLLKRSDAASAWSNVTADWTRDDTARTFTRSGVTDFSDFSIGDNGQNPLPVHIEALTARASAEGIAINWETVSEEALAGFNIYRSEARSDAGAALNAALIPAQAPGAAAGASYTWLDRSCVAGRTYFYTIEAIDLGGAAEHAASVSAVCAAPTAVAVAALAASPVGPSSGWGGLLAVAAVIGGAGLRLRQQRRAGAVDRHS